MPIFGKPERSNPMPQQALPCYHGWTVADNVYLYPEKTRPVKIAIKTTHCLRKFSSFAKLDQCKNCAVGCTMDCFRVEKEYSAVIAIEHLVQCFLQKAEMGIAHSMIFYTNEFFPRLFKPVEELMPKPKKVVGTKVVDKVQELAKEETFVDF